MDKGGYDAVEAPFGIPDAFREFGVLKERVCPGGVKRGHAHVHASERKNPSKSFGPKVLGSAGVYTLKRVKGKDLKNERKT